MRQLQLHTLLAAGLLLGAGSGAATAAEEISHQRAAQLATSCAACHGTEGRVDGNIPSLAGKPFEAMRAQLLAFKAGEMPGATVMDRIAAGYSAAELEAMARFFAQIQD